MNETYNITTATVGGSGLGETATPIMGNDILLQLVLIEHSTGDVTVQTEVGHLYRVNYLDRDLHAGDVYNFGEIPNIREAIDKAVTEQFGRKPEPPYIEQHGEIYTLVDACPLDTLMVLDHFSGLVYRRLCDIAGKDLPVVDAAESSPVSSWTQVFPPKLSTFTKNWFNVSIIAEMSVADHLCEQMRKETAFTVWRLTVTR